MRGGQRLALRSARLHAYLQFPRQNDDGTRWPKLRHGGVSWASNRVVVVMSDNLFLDSVKFWTNSNFALSSTRMDGGPANLLRELGVQVTAQRLAVMEAVSRRPHATADGVAEEVRGVIGTISRQAVYDALGVLVEKGLIRRIQPARSPALYEDRVSDNHHHLICRICGKTVDVDCAVGHAPCLTPSDARGFEVDEAEVIFWGTCPDCLANEHRVGEDDGSALSGQKNK